MVRGDQLGGLLADHDGRGVGVAADDVRHHARVGHAQGLDAVHPQPRVDDVTDPAGRRHVVDGQRVVAGQVLEQRVARLGAGLVAVGLRQVRRDDRLTQAAAGPGLRDLEGPAHHGDHDHHVVRVVEVVERRSAAGPRGPRWPA